MKSQISSVDLHYLLKEMQFLVNARVDKIYHPEKEELLIQLHATGKGKQIIRVIAGKFIFLSDYKEQYESPSGFCMFLRKLLENTKLREISQVGSERIVKLGFETKEERLNVYIELFGKGNVVTTDDKDIIINALEQKKWADREIKKGLKYEYPKREFNVFEMNEKEFEKTMKTGQELVLKLAKGIGLGGLYSEEICTLSKIDKNKKELIEDEEKKLFDIYKKIINNKIHALIIKENNSIKEIIPFEFETYRGLDKQEFPSFNEAFDYFFREQYAAKKEFVSKHQSQIDKQMQIIEQQKKQIQQLEKSAEEEAKKAELIYEKYSLINEILTEINKARQKYNFEEIKNKLKGHKIIKDADGKNKKVTIEV
jgi:predicted ribosome quality control (RQC) complex YloA/Tae2 family protein